MYQWNSSNKSTDHLKARIFKQALNTDRWTVPSLTLNLLLYPPPPPFSVLHWLVSKTKALLICHLGAPPSFLFVLCDAEVNREYGENCFRRKHTPNCAPCSPSLFKRRHMRYILFVWLSLNCRPCIKFSARHQEEIESFLGLGPALRGAHRRTQMAGWNPTEDVRMVRRSWSPGLLLGSTCQFIHWVWSVIIVFLGLENGSIGPVEKFLKNNYFCFFPEVLHDFSKKFQKEKIRQVKLVINQSHCRCNHRSYLDILFSKLLMCVYTHIL